MMRTAYLLAAGMVATFVPRPAMPQTVPAAIAVPGQVPLFTLHAEGALIYQCTQADTGKSWKLHDYAAVLLRDGKNVGRHYSPGPIWQLADGSTVKAKVDVRLPAPAKEDTDWVKFTVIEHSGSGGLDT